MLTARQRNAVLKRLFDFFNSMGKILTEQEYMDARSQPVRYLAIVKGFRTYKSAITMLKKKYPTWELAVPTVIEEPKPKPKKVKDSDPLAALAAKVDAKEEIEDENE